MNEWATGICSTMKVLAIAVFALCYWWGGRKQKWVRRYLGAFLFGGVVIVFSVVQQSFSWWLCAYPFCLSLALTLGYGGDAVREKIRRRFIYGLVVGLSAAPVAIVNGAWLLWGCQIVLCILASVMLGFFNPFFSAVDEENVIAVLMVCLTPFMLGYGYR